MTLTVARSRNYPHGVKVATCAHQTCDRPRWRQQLCLSHYRRLERGTSIAPAIAARKEEAS
jgi:hypothetical protein